MGEQTAVLVAKLSTLKIKHSNTQKKFEGLYFGSSQPFDVIKEQMKGTINVQKSMNNQHKKTYGVKINFYKMTSTTYI